MQAERVVLRFLTECAERWHARFPALHRRAQWHIASHLCVRARTGAPVGELSGMVRQIFLLDDATVRERIGEFCGLGLCALDPADAPVSARTVVVPGQDLLEPFDAYLSDVAEQLRLAAEAIDSGSFRVRFGPLDPAARQALLSAVADPREALITGLEHQFEVGGLSRARRLDLRRHLLSVSHWSILLNALAHRHTPADEQEEGAGMLADEIGAALLGLIRQNFQTTRDHIAYLLQLGILERRAGRALRVGLTPQIAVVLDGGLREAAAALADIAARLPQTEPDAERTGTLRIDSDSSAPAEPDTHVLLVSHPDEPDRIVPLGADPLVIGRAAGNGIVLPAIEVSRAHCRITLAHNEASVTDLNSTNGTFLNGQRISGTARLRPPAVLQVGPYRLEYRQHRAVDPDATMASGGRRGEVTAMRARRGGPG